MKYERKAKAQNAEPKATTAPDEEAIKGQRRTRDFKFFSGGGGSSLYMLNN